MTKLDTVKRKAKSLGLKGEIRVSKSKDKKYDYIEDGKIYSFGAKGMEDYLDHNDKERRKNFRARMSGIKLKDGTRAIDKKPSPAYLSYYILW